MLTTNILKLVPSLKTQENLSDKIMAGHNTHITSGQTYGIDNLNTVPTSHVLSISPKSFKVMEKIYKTLTGFIVFSQTLGKY